MKCIKCNQDKPPSEYFKTGRHTTTCKACLLPAAPQAQAGPPTSKPRDDGTGDAKNPLPVVGAPGERQAPTAPPATPPLFDPQVGMAAMFGQLLIQQKAQTKLLTELVALTKKNNPPL